MSTRHRPFDRRLTLAASALVALLVAGIALTFRDTRRLHEQAGLVVHTQEVISSLERTLSLAKDAETGQRGYLITGEERYLAPYHAAASAIYEQIGQVEQLVADNPQQQAHLPELRRRVAAKLEVLGEAIAVRSSGNFAAAREIVLTDRGQKEMDAIRLLVEEMVEHERDLLRDRSERSAQSYRSALVTGVLSGLAAVLGVVAFMLLLRSFLKARSESAREIAEQGERLRTTLASIGDAVITTDTQGRITHLNAVAESVTGWSAADAVGRPLDVVFRIVNEDTRQPVENPANRASKEGVIIGLANHTVLVRKDGTERPIDDSAAPIRCKEGEIVGCVLVFRDITERRKRERALRESEARKSAMFESALDCIIGMDHEGRVVEFNTAAERTFGYRRDDVLGRELASLIIPPALRERHRRGMAHYLATGEGRVLGQRLQMPAVRSDGTEFPVELTVTRLLEDDPPLFTGTLRDVTDRKQAEQRVQESEERYRAIGEAIDFGVWMCDARGRNTYASQSFLRLLGLSQEQYSELGWAEVAHPDEAAESIAAWQECVRMEGVWDREHRFKGVDGQWHHVLSRGVPVRSEAGQVFSWVGIHLDISRLKQAEEALREADRRKDEFLATLAHELRNPLAPIRNAAQVLQMKGSAGAELEWAKDVIERQTETMTRLIDDLMDVGRISRNKLELRREQVELTALARGVLATNRPLLEEMGHELKLTLPSDPIFLDADPLRLAQVISNLLHNAIKYTERNGRIEVRVERQGSDAVLSVKDTGIGIPADSLRSVFEMFSQVEGALSRSQGGLGIGLSLVKRLIEMHGGTIEAHSEGPGRGSEFTVRLPIALAHEPAARPSADAQTAALSKLRILVVDDSRDAATSLALLLKLMGSSVRTAHDGEEAVRAADEFRPHVVLLDIGLPKLNGYDACRQIRRQPWGRSMALIAVTGWGQEEDRQRSEAAGFDWHMVKPVDPRALMTMLAQLRVVTT